MNSQKLIIVSIYCVYAVSSVRPAGANYHVSEKLAGTTHHASSTSGIDESESPVVTRGLLFTRQARQAPAKKSSSNDVIDTNTNDSVCKGGSGQIPDPSYCDKYHDCWEGKSVASGQCSHGLMFNGKISACDYPMNVDCDGKGVAEPFEDVDEGCDEPYGTFTNPTNCAQFTVCHAGMALRYTCDDGLAYDQDLGVCTSHNTECLSQPEDENVPELQPLDPDNLRPVPPPSSPASGGNDTPQFPIIPPTTQSECKTSTNGFAPAPDDCRYYFVCVQGMGYRVKCPQDTYFNPETASCQRAYSGGSCKHIVGGAT